ncbi:MAG: catalase [Actinomycetota bacterium]|nr:catalase [Actinomycetota bacterium]
MATKKTAAKATKAAKKAVKKTSGKDAPAAAAKRAQKSAQKSAAKTEKVSRALKADSKRTPAAKPPAQTAAKAAAAKAAAAKAKATAPASTAPEAMAKVPSPEKPRSKPDVGVARTVGNPARDDALTPTWAQQGDQLTTSTGTVVDNTDNTLRVGPRGPALLQDHHLREKIMHFDHERIPERVVHARGTGAHGTFRLTESLAEFTSAKVLTDTSAETPVFVRFSTVAGSRGSADTARDVRGFATKFYTPEGNWDLVGNNIPVFFIQDGIKFPDIIHAVKPEPDREIPQAQSAHDTFWDFVSLQPESTHMLMWVMSDRAIPRSFRTMEGFGVHTFRLVNEDGATTLVKFHWKPVAGIHSLVWEESQKLGGIDPDFHRRDLWDAIESGAGPEYDFGVQLFPDNDDQSFEGIDLLDPTKLVPEELAPVRIVGRLTLDRNPTNFFAETEQIAFCTAHVPRGIDFTDDPLLQARNFSYLDTQLTRLGGPNFDQLPINRPRSPVNSNQRDGFGQQAIHEGVAPYFPNSLGGGCPFHAGDAGMVHVPRPVEGTVVRQRPQSFDDHFSQATMFWNSMTPPERDHIVGAFSFELGKCVHPEVRERMVGNLADVAAELCERVAANLGLDAPTGSPAADAGSSPALSQVPPGPGPIMGRVVGVLAADGVDGGGVDALRDALVAEGAALYVIAPRGGAVAGTGGPVPVDRTVMTTQSVEYDAMVVAGGASATAVGADPNTALNLGEAFRHHKVIAAWGEGRAVLESAGIAADAPGVVVGDSADTGFAARLVEAMGWHRHWDRTPPG